MSSAIEPYLCMDGRELFSWPRTRAYLQARGRAVNQLPCQSENCLPCEYYDQSLESGGVGYGETIGDWSTASPGYAGNPAPWYPHPDTDVLATNPELALDAENAFGFVITSSTTEFVYEQDDQDVLEDCPYRLVAFEGFLLGDSPCNTAWLERWLRDKLTACHGNCSTRALTWYECCESVESEACRSGRTAFGAQLSELEFFDPSDIDDSLSQTCVRGFRVAWRVDKPALLGSASMDSEFTPSLKFGELAAVLPVQCWSPLECSTCIPALALCTNLCEPTTDSLNLPPSSSIPFSCYCQPTTFYTPIATLLSPPDLVGLTTMDIRLYGGNEGVRNVRIDVYSDANGPYDPCETPCWSIKVGHVPPLGLLSVDGFLGNGYISCAEGSGYSSQSFSVASTLSGVEGGMPRLMAGRTYYAKVTFSALSFPPDGWLWIERRMVYDDCAAAVVAR